MTGITAHMVVKNEDCWVWYAICSVLPYVDDFLITDTGSSDNTLSIINSIKSPKIHLEEIHASTPKEITKIRNNQLEKTQTPWVWIVDGDEIYPNKLSQEIVEKTKGKARGIVVRRYDLLGDVYHAQHESVGSYEMYGQKGHFSLRLIHLERLKGISYSGDYPLEGFYDGDSKNILDYHPKNFVFTQNKYFHAGYLKRSSLGSNLKSVFNRNKYKIERGFVIPENPPEILKSINSLTNPLVKRGWRYSLISEMMTPIKQLKRIILK